MRVYDPIERMELDSGRAFEHVKAEATRVLTDLFGDSVEEAEEKELTRQELMDRTSPGGPDSGAYYADPETAAAYAAHDEHARVQRAEARAAIRKRDHAEWFRARLRAKLETHMDKIMLTLLGIKTNWIEVTIERNSVMHEALAPRAKQIAAEFAEAWVGANKDFSIASTHRDGKATKVNAPIFLLDVTAYLHRAMHVCYGDAVGSTDLSDDRFLRHACTMIANTMERLSVERMAVVMDSTEPSLRCDEFAAYKAERKPHPPVLAAQAPRFFDALRDISVTVAGAARYEADDIIATLVGQEAGAEYVIVSSDKDLLALVNDTVRMYDPMKDTWLTAAGCVEKFGVKPSQLYDYIGLVGDSSDGIPGVDGIGAKTAAKILREFGTLDDVYERLQALDGYIGRKQYDSIVKNKETALLSRRLAQPRLHKSLVLTGAALNAPSAAIVRKAI